MSGLRADLAMDLGTDHITLFQRGKGILARERNVVCVDRLSGKFLAVGDDARKMLGKTPTSMVGIKSVKNGAIAEYEITKRLIKYLIQKTIKLAFIRPRMVVGVPVGASTVQRTALLEVCQEAGLSHVYLMESSLATALAEGLDIEKPLGRLVVDIGAGLSEASVISLGEVVVGSQLAVAGDAFDQAIVDGIKKSHGILIGPYTAKDIKEHIGTVIPAGEDKSIYVAGRDLRTGIPREVIVHSEEIRFMLDEPITAILDMIEDLLDHTPPELVADIYQHGVLLTGGASQLTGFTDRLRERIKVPVHRASNLETGVALGLGEALNAMPLLESKLTSLMESLPQKKK